LSTIVVSNVNDSGPGSLRLAVADAVNGDSIVFSNRLAGQTIVLQSEIDVTNNISISGPATRPVALSGGGKTRVLEIDGATVSLTNLVITQGSADIGGGILDSNGNLSLSNVGFTGNVAYGSSTEIAQGGAIAQQSGSLLINRSTFTGNRVIGDPESPVVLPPIIIDPLGPVGPVVIDPIIVLPSPAHFGGEADGGAIADQGGTLVIRNSAFKSNVAIGSAVQTDRTGGDAYGGAIFVADATLNASGSTFQANQAIGGNFVNNGSSSQSVGLAAGSANGGAIASESASLSLQNNTIRLNAAQGGQAQGSDGSAGGQGGYASGGAIVLLNTSTLSVFGGTISSNQALGGSGASPSNPQPEFFPPSGGASGGGIASEDYSSVSIDETTFADDVARSGSSPNPSASNSYAYAEAAYGGAIDFEAFGSLVLTQANLRGNSAFGGNAESPGQAYGGGVAVQSADLVTIVDSILQGNLAETGQGFVPLNPSVNPNSLVYNQASGGGIFVNYASGIFSLVDSRIISNRVIGVGSGVATGGGLSLNGVQANLVKVTLQSNAAIGGPIVTNVSFGQASGGAIAVSGRTMTVTDSTFVGNQATTAAVNNEYAQMGSNDASLGGAIANEGASLEILGSSFTGNQASGGAGVAGSQGANGQGGAIDIEANGSLDLSSSTVVGNQASATGGGQGLGGGIYLAASSTSALEGNTIVKNKATTSGDNIENLSQ